VGAKTARRRRHRNLHGGLASRMWGTNSTYRRQQRYASREVRRIERTLARDGFAIGFRTHPEFGHCGAVLRELGYRIVTRGKILELEQCARP